MRRSSSTWKEEGAINRAEPKEAAISPWISGFVPRHRDFGPEQELSAGDLPGEKMPGTRSQSLLQG